jgi:hypothetical protein
VFDGKYILYTRDQDKAVDISLGIGRTMRRVSFFFFRFFFFSFSFLFFFFLFFWFLVYVPRL